MKQSKYLVPGCVSPPPSLKDSTSESGIVAGRYPQSGAMAKGLQQQQRLAVQKVGGQNLSTSKDYSFSFWPTKGIPRALKGLANSG